MICQEGVKSEMQSGSPIRRALSGEAAALSELGRELFRQGYLATHPEPEFSRYVARTFSPEVFTRDLADPHKVVLVADEPSTGSLIAYAVLRDGSPSSEQSTDYEGAPIEILRFYVDEKWHGAGVAQALMTACVAEATTRRRDVIWVQTWQQSARALAFYEKMGFVVAGTAKFEFGDRFDDDFLLVRRV
jgi:ribosomal protein S18 acetylase RimI-like enzyme